MQFDPSTTVLNIRSKAPSAKGNSRHNGNRHRRRSQFKGGRRVAVIKALAAAKSYDEGRFPTLEDTALGHGTNTVYVAAALVLWKANDPLLLKRVLFGDISLLAAAKKAGRLLKAVTTFRSLRGSELPAFGQAVGIAYLWDNVITPAI